MRKEYMMTLSHLTSVEPEMAPLRLPRPARTSQAAMVPLGSSGAGTFSLGVLSDAVTGLLIRSGRGDTDAFAELYDVTSRRIYGLVLRAVPSMEAERFTQVAYVRLWSSARHYSPAAGNALSWMITQAHHSATEHGLGSSVAFKGPQLGGRRAVHPPASLCPAVASDVSELTRNHQDILTLVCLGGYNPRQVSELLRLPRVSVLTILRDGLLRIRDPLPAAS